MLQECNLETTDDNFLLVGENVSLCSPSLNVSLNNGALLTVINQTDWDRISLIPLAAVCRC